MCIHCQHTIHVHMHNNTVNSLAHASTVLQMCMCSRNNTAGSIQVTNTAVEVMAMAVTRCGTEGTEEERGETKTALYRAINHRLQVTYPLYALSLHVTEGVLTVSSVYAELSTEWSKGHSEGPH